MGTRDGLPDRSRPERDPDAWPSFKSIMSKAMVVNEFDRDEIEDLLPHSPEFVFVSEAVVESDDAVRGRYVPDGTHPIFDWHFPGDPVLPGVVGIEALAQLAGLLVLDRRAGTSDSPRLARVRDVRFENEVRPGDALEMECTVTNEKLGFVEFEGSTGVAGETAITAEFLLSV